MQRFMWRIAGLLSLAAAAACGSAPNVEQARADLLAVDQEWAGTAKDPEQYLVYFDAGAVVYPPGAPVITGIDAIRKSYVELSSTPGFALSWTPAKAQVAASGDLGHTSGAYELTIGGVTEKGKYVTAWKREGGEWKVIDDIFNADASPTPPAGTHAMVPPNTLKWGDAPPGLPAGSRMAVVSGDPGKAEPFVIRAQLPAGYRIAPHWHPTTENITVLTGTIALGPGEKMDEVMQDLPAGAFASLPAEMRHTFMARTAATIQVHGVGPFGITYVNPADDPRAKKSN